LVSAVRSGKGKLLTRERFSQQMNALSAATAVLGEQASTAVEQAIQAFSTYDPGLAERVVNEDNGINRMERQILDDASILLMLQAPVASDLRRILGVSRIAASFERIGDHAVSIAKAVLRLAAPPALGEQGDLEQIGRQVSLMLSEGLRSYVDSDVELARTVSKVDDGVDVAYSHLFRELLAEMVEDSTLIARATYTLFVARDLERIADHMANVMETVIYIATGETVELN
jgi:phosphate transport system protein